MKNNIFIDDLGYLWFKQNSGLWLDHSDSSQAKRARLDNNGTPKLAGSDLTGELVAEAATPQITCLVVMETIENMKLPDYLKGQLNKLCRIIIGEGAH